jgi:thioredoxin-related protein
MKKTLILMFVAVLASCGGYAQQTQEGPVKWTPIAQAEQSNGNQQKMYFIDFSTSWCGWCKKMDNSTFTDPVVAAILNQYFVPVKFNAEGNESFVWNGNKYAPTPAVGNRPATHPFTRAVLGQKLGYPSFAIFNGKQELLTILQGYQSAYDFSMVLWYICSGDNSRYTFENYQNIFDQQIKPGMMKKLGLAK